MLGTIDSHRLWSSTQVTAAINEYSGVLTPNENWQWCASNGTTYVFTANIAGTAVSYNGSTWTKYAAGGPSPLGPICFNGTTYISVTYGYTYTSYDGITWTYTTNNLSSGAGYGDPQIVYNGSIYTTGSSWSSNGTTWTACVVSGGPSPGTWTFQDIATNGSTFVATGGNCIFYSTDGKTFNAQTLPTQIAAGPVTNNGRVWVVLASGILYYGSYVEGMYSLDGVTWNAMSINNRYSWTSVSANGNKIVALTSNQTAITTDGINWTVLGLPNSKTYLGLTALGNTWISASNPFASLAYGGTSALTITV